MIDFASRIIAGAPSRHSTQFDRHRRASRAIISAQIRNHLIRLTMAQCPGDAADRLKPQRVTHLAIALHIDGLETHAVAGRPVAILAGERIAETIVGGKPSRDHTAWLRNYRSGP